MTTVEARKLMLDAAAEAAKAGKPEESDKIRLVAEYLTNPDFRKWMEDTTAKANGL